MLCDNILIWLANEICYLLDIDTVFLIKRPISPCVHIENELVKHMMRLDEAISTLTGSGA